MREIWYTRALWTPLNVLEHLFLFMEDTDTRGDNEDLAASVEEASVQEIVDSSANISPEMVNTTAKTQPETEPG